MKRVLFIFITAHILFFCHTAHAGYRTDGPWKGQVLDAETKRPVAGAVVVIYWIEKYSILWDTGTKFLDAKEYLTDEEGKFFIYRPVISGKTWEQNIIEGPFFFIYQNGYDFYLNGPDEKGEPFYEKETVVFLHQLKTKKRRLEILGQLLPFKFDKKREKELMPQAFRMKEAEKNELLENIWDSFRRR